MVNPSEHGVSRVVHHKDYYLRGGDMTVLVENHLYRIHSYFFERESLFFRQKMTGSNDDGEERGSSDQNAYTLEDVKSEDFARFLWVFYNPKYSLYEAPLETWLSILQLANRWSFSNVKELTVRELEKLEIEPIEKIAIYHDNSINRLYLLPSYIAVCKRDKPLSFTEGMKLGMETVLRVADARERVRQHASESGIRTPTFDDFEDSEVEVLIRDVFGLTSRPTSPAPATAPTNGFFNGSSHNAASSPAIKLNNPPKANGASAARSNGGSAADAAPKASADTMPSISAVMGAQTSTAPAPTRASQATTSPTQVPPATTAPAPAKPAQAESATPPPPPPPMDKPNQGTSNGSAPESAKPTGGSGEPSSSVEGKVETAGCPVSHDSITQHVVPKPEQSNDVSESNEDENDAEKDEQTKDAGLLGVFSDSEGGKGPNQGSRRNNKSRAGKGGKKPGQC